MKGWMLAGLLACALSSWGQNHHAVGFEAPLPIKADPDAMTDELHGGKPAQSEDLLRRLGIEAEVARPAAAALPQTGLRVDRIEGTGANLLFVPCDSTLRAAHLYLLRPDKDTWRVVDDAALDCWWANSSYEFVRVPGRQGMLVLAHHLYEGHGTGFVRDDMELLEARGTHWAAVLRTQEYESEETIGEALMTEEASTLQPLPDGSVEETRATTLHEGSPERVRLAKVERRRWRWNAGKLAAGMLRGVM